MIKNDATFIAVKISQGWPRSAIATDVWEEELAELDKGRAEQTVRQLRRSDEHAPSIARFMQAYRDLAGSAHEPEWICPGCNNDRWITDLLHPEHNGYWRERLDDEGRARVSMPVLQGPNGPEPDICICNIMRPCPRCNAPKDGVRDHG